MLVGLMLAPLSDQQQDGVDDTEEERQKPQPLQMQQKPLTPNAEAPLISPASSMANDSSVDVAAKKVFLPPLSF